MLREFKISQYLSDPKLNLLSLTGGFLFDSSNFLELVNDFAFLSNEENYPFNNIYY